MRGGEEGRCAKMGGPPDDQRVLKVSDGEVTGSASSSRGRLPTKSELCQARESPAGARFAPLISTQVFGAMVGLSPSAFATSEITEPYAMLKSDSIITVAYGFQVAIMRSEEHTSELQSPMY